MKTLRTRGQNSNAMSKIALKDFMYVRGKTQNGRTYWRCEDYLKCKIHVSSAEDNVLMTKPSEHSHFISRYFRAIAQM